MFGSFLEGVLLILNGIAVLQVRQTWSYDQNQPQQGFCLHVAILAVDEAVK
jgi:hypothetical protein